MAGAANDTGELRRLASRRRSYENLKDAAADLIRDAIVTGHLAPHSKVDQDEIAEALGISRVPVREALIELAQKDFVVAIPRRGAFVRQVSIRDIEDHYEVVALVFALTTKRAVKLLSAADLDELRRLHAAIATTKDATRREELDTQFLTVIARAGSSHRLDAILRFLGGALAGRFYYQWSGWAAKEESYRTTLLAALDARDGRAASRLTEAHIRSCAEPTIALMNTRGYWAHPEPDPA
jgi:DNA-binding GntR family transcriptional regulator